MTANAMTVLRQRRATALLVLFLLMGLGLIPGPGRPAVATADDDPPGLPVGDLPAPSGPWREVLRATDQIQVVGDVLLATGVIRTQVDGNSLMIQTEADTAGHVAMTLKLREGHDAAGVQTVRAYLVAVRIRFDRPVQVLLGAGPAMRLATIHYVAPGHSLPADDPALPAADPALPAADPALPAAPLAERLLAAIAGGARPIGDHIRVAAIERLDVRLRTGARLAGRDGEVTIGDGSVIALRDLSLDEQGWHAGPTSRVTLRSRGPARLALDGDVGLSGEDVQLDLQGAVRVASGSLTFEGGPAGTALRASRLSVRRGDSSDLATLTDLELDVRELSARVRDRDTDVAVVASRGRATLLAGPFATSALELERIGATALQLDHLVVGPAGLRAGLAITLDAKGVASAGSTGALRASRLTTTLKGRLEVDARGLTACGADVAPGADDAPGTDGSRLSAAEVTFESQGGTAVTAAALDLEVSRWTLSAPRDTAPTFGLELRSASADALALAMRGRTLGAHRVCAPRLALEVGAAPGPTATFPDGLTLHGARLDTPIGAGRLVLEDTQLDLPPVSIVGGVTQVETVRVAPGRLRIVGRDDSAVTLEGARVDLVLPTPIAVDLAAGTAGPFPPFTLTVDASRLLIERPGRTSLSISGLSATVQHAPPRIDVALTGAARIGDVDARLEITGAALVGEDGRVGLRSFAGRVVTDLSSVEAEARDGLVAAMREWNPKVFDEFQWFNFKFSNGRASATGAQVSVRDGAPNTLSVHADGHVWADRRKLHLKLFDAEWRDDGTKNLLTFGVDGRVELAIQPGPLATLTAGVRAIGERFRAEPHLNPLDGIRVAGEMGDRLLFDRPVRVVTDEVAVRWPQPVRDLVVESASLRREGGQVSVDFTARAME